MLEAKPVVAPAPAVEAKPAVVAIPTNSCTGFAEAPKPEPVVEKKPEPKPEPKAEVRPGFVARSALREQARGGDADRRRSRGEGRRARQGHAAGAVER